MKKIVKRILIGLGACIFLLIIAVTALFIFIDPNDYRDEIAQMAYKATGRKVELQGDIALKIFPGLGFSIKNVSVAQAGSSTAGADAPLAHVDELNLKMALFPLLKKQVQVDAVRLDGLSLNLAKDAKGRYNWETPQNGGTAGSSAASAETSAPGGGAGPGSSATAAETSAPGGGAEPGSSATTAETSAPGDAGDGMQALLQSEIAEISITNCVLNYNDIPAKESLSLRLNRLALSGVGLNRDVGCALDASVELGKDLKAGLSADTQIRYELAEKILKLDVRSFALGLEAPEYLAGRQEIRGNANVALNAGSGQLDLKAMLEGAFLNGTAVVALNGGEGDGALAFKASPAVLLNALSDSMRKSLALPPAALADNGPLRNLDAALNFRLSGNNLTLADLKLTLGGTLVDLTSKKTDIRLEPAGPLLPVHSVSGDFSLAARPRALMNGLGVKLETADAGVMESFQSSFRLAVDNASLKIGDLKGKLDETEISALVELLLPGAAGIPRGATSYAKASMQLGALDLDRYLPPDSAAAQGGSQPAGSGRTEPGAPSGGPLRGTGLEKARAEFSAGIKSLTVMKTPLQDVSLNCVLADGVLTVSRAGLKAFDGQLNLSGAADLVNANGAGSLKTSLAGLNLGSALGTMFGERRLSGQTSANLDFTFKGLDSASILKTLNGKGDILLKNGALYGIQLIPHDAPALLLGHRLENYNFTDLGGSFTVVEGRLHNNDLSYKDKNLSLTGKGSVALYDRQIDYSGVIKTSQAGEVPLRIQGHLSSLSITLDQEALAKMALEKGQEALTRDLQKKGVLPQGVAPADLGQEAQKQINEKVGQELQRGLGKLFNK